MSPVSWRSAKLVYYGPFKCENCGIMICRIGREWGGNSFTYPKEPIFPNTEWHPHVCDPDLVRQVLGSTAEATVRESFSKANPFKVGQLGYVILGEEIPQNVAGGKYLVISPNQTFCDTVPAAWSAALERQQNSWPSWHIDLSRYNENSTFGNDLEKLPECPPSSGTTIKM